MQALIEAPYYESELLCSWPVPEFKSFSMIRLHGEMPYKMKTLIEIQRILSPIALHLNMPC